MSSTRSSARAAPSTASAGKRFRSPRHEPGPALPHSSSSGHRPIHTQPVFSKTTLSHEDSRLTARNDANWLAAAHVLPRRPSHVHSPPRALGLIFVFRPIRVRMGAIGDGKCDGVRIHIRHLFTHDRTQSWDQSRLRCRERSRGSERGKVGTLECRVFMRWVVFENTGGLCVSACGVAF